VVVATAPVKVGAYMSLLTKVKRELEDNGTQQEGDETASAMGVKIACPQ
jgi:hypothetical protein